MMHTYFAYGLGIHSEIELPELAPAQANPDIVILFARADIFPPAGASASEKFFADATEARVHYDGVGGFSIHRGCEIALAPEPQANLQEVRLTLLGPVFAILLHQRGLLVLHASAVAIDHRAIAFLAEAGGGKSTTAAALLTRGYQLVSDDLVALAPDAAQPPWVYPAYPFLKLWPQAARALGQDLLAAPRVSPQLDKRIWRINNSSAAPVELKRIYLLDQGAHPGIESLAAPEAFIALVRHTFVALLLDATDTTQKHFQQCSILANQVPVRRLRIPTALEALATVAELVDADLTRDAN